MEGRLHGSVNEGACCRAGDPHSVPEIHVVKRESTPIKLSSDLHTYGTKMHTFTQTQIHTINKWKKVLKSRKTKTEENKCILSANSRTIHTECAVHLKCFAMIISQASLTLPLKLMMICEMPNQIAWIWNLSSPPISYVTWRKLFEFLWVLWALRNVLTHRAARA